ncbi:MAG: glycosyltransferase family 9 protein [Betaproteobacteria bacterium]
MKILVIRRDNIGDLVCTTPLFSALRRHYPESRIDALVNSYNAPVLINNPEIDQVHVYRKAKHRSAGESRFAIWLETCRLIVRLRRTQFDLIIVATPSHQPGAVRFARWIGAKQIIACAANDTPSGLGHEAEQVMHLLHPLGIKEAPGLLHLHADPQRAAAFSIPPPPQGNSPLIGLHISARKTSQRWPIERFAELAGALHTRHGARFLLFWSPGAENHPQHPGDDDKVKRLLELCRTLPLVACRTERLDELIAGLSLCDRIICSDGGAMHIAAGLGKPLVCFFGNSGAEHWHPWGVKHELLQPSSRDVSDITVTDALAAFERLEQRLIAE